MSKRIKKLLTLVFAIAMCLSIATTAFAANGVPIVTDDEDKPVEAAITKLLQMPYGTVLPAADFEFVVTPISYETDTTPAVVNAMPKLGTNNEFKISFAGTETGTTAANSDVTEYVKETANIFAGVTFPTAGVYVYEIVERANTYTVNPTPPPYETMTYSLAKYTLNVYVANHSKGGTYVKAIGDVQTTKDDGTPGGNKVDPTPGGNQVDYFYSQMIFTNVYYKINGDVDDDISSFELSKAVAGDFANLDTYFEFEVAVHKPSLVPTASGNYKAYVIDASGAVVTAAANYAGTIGSDGSIAFTSGQEEVVKLKPNQKLVFFDVHVGSTYVVIESAIDDYVASAVITYNGGTANTTVGPPGTSSTIQNVNDKTALSTDTQFIGELENSAAFTNTHKGSTPTGLDINDLPFIGLIVLAIAALIAFVVVKARKKSVR